MLLRLVQPNLRLVGTMTSQYKGHLRKTMWGYLMPPQLRTPQGDATIRPAYARSNTIASTSNNPRTYNNVETPQVTAATAMRSNSNPWRHNVDRGKYARPSAGKIHISL